MQQTNKDTAQQRGSIVVTILYVMMFLTTLLFGLVLLANANLQRAYQRIYLLQAQYAAESGADAALAVINNTNPGFTGTTSDVTVLSNTQYKATYATTVAAGVSGSQMVITATGKIYRPVTATSPQYTRKIRVTIQRSSTSSASGIMSRNIIDVDSSIKNIVGKDIYLNGFINIRSNTTNLYFETLTVGGKDTTAANCSIEGSGHLNKATTLGASKATITTAFNNCITPPGNTSNTTFNVSANNSGISTIQSMYVPWSQYMDSSYQNSPTGCADWTAAGTTLTIPSTGNTKKTHYPDSGSGIVSTCGTNGSLALGTKTYNITDNVHIRANLCAASACAPTFNNTSGSIKYIFVEGYINFAAITTSTGSSPIVLITYAADPGLHTTQCPYGDSIFLNNNGSGGTNAPAIYLLATNSVCLYQTKFTGNPALGGLGGKNLYISTNSGTPFDLGLDPNFPVSQIPVNLSWRATGYERL